ncbi:MAG: PleD family two-component system response regulator [Elusimicrobiota bacterium]
MDWFKKKKKIIVVEDEQDIADNIKARLELDGYIVLLAGNGKDGVDLIRKEKPSLVILDVMMPIIDGYEACKILKRDEETKSIPILILTALPYVNDVEKAFEVGANDFLNKPYTNERLMMKVNKLIKN